MNREEQREWMERNRAEHQAWWQSQQERMQHEQDQAAEERRHRELMSASSGNTSYSGGSINMAPFFKFLFKACLLAFPIGMVFHALTMHYTPNEWNSTFHFANWAHWAPWAQYVVECEILGLMALFGAPIALAVIAAYYAATPFGGLHSNGIIPMSVAIVVGFFTVTLCYIVIWTITALIVAMILAPLFMPFFNLALRKMKTDYRVSYWVTVLIIMAFWVFRGRIHRMSVKYFGGRA